jgi:Fibrillar collagen C-terminal domain
MAAQEGIIDKHEEAVANLETKMVAQEGIVDKLKTPNPKTCDTILQSDPSKESGMYWIDPDGQGQGDGPIYVYCNMSSGQVPQRPISYHNFLGNNPHFGLINRCNFDFARLRGQHGRWPLQKCWLLLSVHHVQRHHEADHCAYSRVNELSPAHSGLCAVH